MAQELGEVDDEADETNPAKLLEGLDRLRGMVTFLPLNEEWIGFGEAHPADGNRKDGAASQQNRRVEILFFESGQEPDVAILKEAPEITELYSPDAFVRERLPERPGGARRHWTYRVAIHRVVGNPTPVVIRAYSTNTAYDQQRTISGEPSEEQPFAILEFTDIPRGARLFVDRIQSGVTVSLRRNFPVTRAKMTAFRTTSALPATQVGHDEASDYSTYELEP